MNWKEMRTAKNLIRLMMKYATYEQKLELQQSLDNKIPLKQELRGIR